MTSCFEGIIYDLIFVLILSQAFALQYSANDYAFYLSLFMISKHIVLRNPGAVADDIFPDPKETGGAASASVSAAVKLSVDVKELEEKEAQSVTKEEAIVAVAPSMPVKLITPFQIAFPAEEITQNMAWGIKAVGADTSPFTGEGIIVAVLDTGIDADHPAFAGVKIVQKDFTGEGNGDAHGHGTHCAATIFGRSVDGTRIGVAPGVKKVLIGKVLGLRGGGSSDMIVSAIQWAVENGANIISMSLGIDFPGYVKQLQDRGLPPELATSKALEGYRANVQLFEKLASFIRVQSAGGFAQPALLIAAAGNESRRNESADFEIAVSPPAVSDGFISVAALGQGTQGFVVAPFSNTGANIAAPGVGIVSARAGGGLATMSGTSMATPYVAGVAALWAEKIKKQSQLNALVFTSRLLGSGRSENIDPSMDPLDYGAGMVQAPQN